MRIRLARSAGFCMGVRRAVDIVMNASEGKVELLTDGPLIHNPQVLEMLEKKGVSVADSIDQADGRDLVVRAHGVSPQRRSEMDRICRKVIDATCPRVKRVQAIVKEHTTKGEHVVIVGDRGHAEVEALLGFAGEHGHIISNEKEVDDLPALDGAVCVVSQTTQNMQVFEAAVAKLKSRYPDCTVFSTICNSTEQRQNEVRRLCREVDAMVVVGGRNSANTKRLAEVAEAEGKPAFHVETEAELNVDELLKFRSVGVTAGASTPNWMIRRVVDKIAWEAGKHPGNVACFVARMLHIPVRTCLYVGFGAAALTCASSRVVGVDPQWDLCALAGLFVFAMHLLNHITNREADLLNHPSRALFYGKHRRLLSWMGIGALLVGVVVAAHMTRSVFILYLAGSTLGLAYQVPILPRGGKWDAIRRKLGVQKLWGTDRSLSLALIPGGKETLTSGAHAMVAALFPFLEEGGSVGGFAAAAVFAFVLVLTRMVLFELRGIQGDQFAGKETMPIAIGIRRSMQVVIGSCILASLMLCLAYWKGWTGSVALFLILPVGYGLACFLLAGRPWWITHEIFLETGVDATFLLAGLIACTALT